MCGLVGIINKSQPVNREWLKNMADIISHRGPDSEGEYVTNTIGLYHKRLSIIDLASGQQPMETDKYVIVFNGEIYNYIELREDLRRKGHQFRTSSDTEVILHMYEEYGRESINQLNGMFAFLLYDKRREIIVAARDHFGIKPLYFYTDSEKYLFASEIKALLVHPEIKSEVNSDSLSDYLTFQFVLGSDTLFKNIRKVAPGTYMVINANSFDCQVVKYWTPNFSLDKDHTEEYFIHELRYLIEDTIRMQLRSDVKIGTYLSGGLDSSLVTSIATKILGQSIATFSGAFNEGPEFNEMEYVNELVQHCNSESHSIYPTSKDFVELLPKLLFHMDEPVAGPGLFPQYMVSKLAADQVKVILGGQGGDEIFGGYARYVIAYLEQALKGAINNSTEEGEHIVSLKTILPNLQSIVQYQPMLKQFWSKEVFEPMDRRYFHLIDRMESNTNYYTDDFLRKYQKDNSFKRFKTLFNNPNTFSYYNKMTHFDMVGSLPALLHVEDRMSMAVSIESRVPLLDRRIVDLIASMPASMKFKGAEMKYILKKAVGDYLPPKILNRKDKMGFPVPLHLWSRNGARDFIHDILLSKQSRERGIFDIEKLEKVIDNEHAFGRQLWGMLCLEIWFQTFIDNN